METSNRLPARVSAFVGRERERGMVAGLIVSARVVTLTGSGGCGKTRLAMEVAGDAAARFPGGSCWVDLQGASEPSMVGVLVADAVGVRESREHALTGSLIEQLRSERLLIVLDNCEHLIAGCATLVSELLSACPGLHVLATSRVPLVVEGEVTFEVPPLPVPADEAETTGAIAATDAARLFEVRARQADPQFRIDRDNAVPVAEICRRLDGIPLAIELAAARIRVLSPVQIAEGLSDRFGLLTRGLRGAPARQQTLEASLAWSYELLDEAQRLALARLSIFAGSFEIEAAEAAMGEEGIAGAAALDIVAGLVDQSMVEVVERQGRARYRLLETIRVYARQRLSELDDPDRARERHVAFHRALAVEARVGLDGRESVEWMARLTASLDDLRAAMVSAASSGDLPALVDLTEPIVRFWIGRGMSTEVADRLLGAVNRPEAGADERARGLITATALAGDGGDYAMAYRSASRAVDAARAASMGDLLAIGLGLRAFMGVLSGLAPSNRMDADVEEALARAEQCDVAAVRAYAAQNAAGTLLFGRAIDEGVRHLELLVAECEAHELQFQLPAVHAALGLWPVLAGQLDDTRRHARLAVDLSRQTGRPGWEVVGLTGLAAVDVVQGEYARAQELLSKARSVLRRRGLAGGQYEASLLPWEALLAYAAGETRAAHTAASETVQLGRDGASHWVDAMGEWLLGEVARVEGRLADARTHWEVSRQRARHSGLRFQLGRSQLGLADLARRDDGFDAAWELVHEALGNLDDYGDRLGTAEALETVADLALANDEPDRALRLLAASDRFHAESGVVRFPGSDERVARVHSGAFAMLGQADASACSDEGGRLSLPEAVDYVRRGRGERRRPRVGWASLTPVERDVVRLVASGLTNAEIGRRLFMSVNTVKKHLTHVYSKVDVDGRAELSAEVVRRDL